MIASVLLHFVITFTSSGCPAACTLEIVSVIQHTNGACDPQCNSESCGFEDECLAQCLDSGCELSLLGNGQCDGECAGELCAFDRGDCGFCAEGCFSFMLQNDLCEEACFTPACDFDSCGDCAPDCFAQEVYVFEGAPISNGTVEFPYASIDLAFASLVGPTAIYLLGPRIAMWESQRIEDPVYIQSLLCGDRRTDFCVTEFTSIDLRRPATLTVISSVTFARVRLTSEAAFDAVKYCPQLVFADGVWTRVDGGVAAEAEVAAASVCEAFKSTVLFRAIGNFTLTVSCIQAVTIDTLTVQPLALVSIEGGHVLFEEVNFHNFHTQRSGGDSAVVVASTAPVSGSFRFLSGSVDFLNLAVHYSAGLALAPFLLARYIETVEIRAVAFRFNFVVEAYSNFLEQSQSALLYLHNFYRLKIADCDFSNNFVSGGLIVVTSSVKLPTEESMTAFTETHILLSSLNFSWNLGEHCLISIRTEEDRLNIILSGGVFTRNAIEAANLLSFLSVHAPNAEPEGTQFPRHFDFQEVTITENFASNQLVLISHMENVQLASVSVADSGDSDADVLSRVYGEFAAGTNSTILPLFPAAPQCVSFVFVDACVGVTVRSVSFQRNYCAHGVCGLEFQDTVDLVTVADFLSEYNFCSSQKAVSLHYSVFANISLTRVIFRENTSYESGVMIFGSLSHIQMTDSICAKNLGCYGTCIYLDHGSMANLTRVQFLDNQSDGSIGGGIAFWVGNELPLYLTITDSVFQGNYATKGGVFAFDMVNTTSIWLEARNSVFTGNSADLMGAVLYMMMPAVFLDGSAFHNCTFEENNSAYGVLWTMHVAGTLRISDSVFRHNSGSATPALSIETQPEALTLVENVVFEENFDGPVILKANSRTNSSIVTRNCTFLNNQMGSVAMEGGFWQDSNSRYDNSAVSQILLSFGTIAELWSAVVTGSSVAESGGAVHAMSRSTFRCFDCVFESNSAGYAGAAIFAEQDGSVLLDNCLFVNNTAGTGGAVLFLTSSMSAESVIRSSTIEQNYGGNFGVIFAQAAVFRLENVTISSNIGSGCPGITQLMSHATITASAFMSMSGSLAAFLSLYTSSSAIISDCYFSGAVVLNGGAIYLSSLSNLTVTSSVFFNVESVQGGVVTAMSSSTVALTDVTMKRLSSQAAGSILYLSDSSLFISSSVFKGFHGSGIFGYQLNEVVISESTFEDGGGELGGAANFYGCLQVTVQGSSFIQLSGQVGGALYFTAIESSAPGTATIAQSHFAENESEKGGAISCTNYNLSVLDSTFVHNAAVEGGALSLQCTATEMCAYAISASEFTSNSASVRGGAISWTSREPLTSTTIFAGNIAVYGPDFASFPVALKAEFQSSDLRAIAPGQDAKLSLAVSLRDHYGQRISIDNSSSAEIGPSSAGCTVSGETRTTADRGLLIFERYIVYAKPSSTVELAFESEAIPEEQANSSNSHTPALHLSLRIRDCEPGEYRRSDSCEVCAAGTYSFEPAVPCQTCPSNAQCLGNYTVTPNSGYWRPGEFSPVLLACPNADACLGGMVQGRALSLTGWCAAGYKGNLCQSCDHDFSRAGKNRCERCPDRDINIVRLTFIAFGMCILVSIIIWSTLRSAARSAAAQSVLIRIFMNYLQLVLLVSDFKLQWPKEVLQLFQMQEAIGGLVNQVYSIDCFLNDQSSNSSAFYRKTMLMAVLPLPLVGASVLFWMCVALHKGTWRVVKQECVATAIILYFLVLPNLVKTLFSMFSCSEIETGEFWLSVDLDIRCWDSTHTFYMLTVGTPGLLVWVVSVPLLCLVAVRRNRKRLNDIEVRMRYGFLISGYRLRFYYWEFIILYRKVVIICIAIFISNSVSLQALTVQFVLLMALFTQYRVQPFYDPRINAVELRSIIVADVTIFCGLYYVTNDASGVTSLLLFFLIVAINAVFAAHWLYALVLHIAKLCSRRSAFFRRIARPGRHYDEELESFIEDFAASEKLIRVHSLKHFCKEMLRNRVLNSPNDSSFLSYSSPESCLIQIR